MMHGKLSWIYKKVNYGGLHYWTKSGLDSKKNLKKIIRGNMAFSLDYYPTDFKISEYEGLIYRKICHRQMKTKNLCYGLQWVLISHLGHFKLFFDDEISVLFFT